MTWWASVVLVLGVFRLTRLVGWDDVTATLRGRVTGLTDAEYHEWAALVWRAQQGDADRGIQPVDPWVDGIPPSVYAPDETAFAQAALRPALLPVGRARFKLAQLVRCPWCAGFWLSVAAYAAYRADASVTMTIAAPLAISAAVGFTTKHLDT